MLRKLTSIALATALAGACVAALAVPASASTTVTVGHGDLSPSCAPTTNWYSSDDVTCGTGDVSFVTGPGTPPSGTGSARIATALTTDRSLLANLDPAYGGIRFDAITTLQYSTYRSSVDAGNNLAIALQFDADYDVTDTTNSFQGRIVFEPYQTFPGGVPQNTWQTWNPLAGKWWASSSSPIVGNTTVTQQCPQATPCTWAQFLTYYPNAGMRQAPNNRFLFKAGNTWPGFVGNVDAFTIGVNGVDTTYDFEPVTCSTDCYVSPTGSDSNSGFSNDPFKTIAKAISTVSTGGNVHVAAGTYNEVVSANKSITLLGAQAGVDARSRSGSETILAAPVSGETPLWIPANDVTVDGFTVEGNTNNNLVGAGVYIQPGTHGTQFVNNIVQNNIIGLYLANNNVGDPTLLQHNLFQNNTNPGSASGTDIYADDSTAGGPILGATVDANEFTNSSFVEDAWAIDMSNTAVTQFSNVTVSNNSIDNHGRGVLIGGTADSNVSDNTFTPGPLNHYGVSISNFGLNVTSSNIAISGNTLGCATSCVGDGVLVSDPAATGVTVNRNDVQGFAPGISSDATAGIDGTCNWWGAPSGPGVGAVAGGGPVTTSPWLLGSNLAGTCALADTSLAYTGDTSGTQGHFATLSASLTQLLGGAPVVGRTVVFTLGSGGSAQTASAVTDASGAATTTAIVPDQDAGSVPVSVSFAGDSVYAATTGSSSYNVSKASTSLAMFAPRDVFVSAAVPTLSAHATLSSTRVTSSGSSSVGVAGRAVSFVVCHVPSGGCFTFAGSTTDASGASHISVPFSHAIGQYSIQARFAGTGDQRYTGTTSSTMPVMVVRFYTRIVATTSGGQYRGGVVVSMHLDYGFFSGKLKRLGGMPVSFYVMPSARSTDTNAGTLIGTATTGTTGVASVLYRMSRTHPPAPGTVLAFAVVYRGSSDLSFAPSQSPTKTQVVVARATTLSLTANRAAHGLVNMAMTLTTSPLTYVTVSNNHTTTVTIPGAPIANATITEQWFDSSNHFDGSFLVQTNTAGQATDVRQPPTGATKVRAVYSAGPHGPLIVSNTVIF